MNMLMKSKTFKNKKGEKIKILSRDIQSRKDPYIERIPWITAEQYVTWINVRGWGGKPSLWYVTIPTWESLWSYNITSSSIWFTPKFVNIQWYLDWTTKSSCDISIDWTITVWLYDIWGSPRFNSTRAINLFDSAGSRFQADFIWFINWGIEVDITQNSYANDVELVITAYS